MNSRSGLLSRRGTLLPLLLLVLGESCTLPDLHPFATATADLDLAVRQTQDFVVDDLRSLAAEVEHQVPSASAEARELESAAEIFSAEWTKRTSAMQALLAYSNSLANIADAGKKGSENSRALAESVNKLLGAIPSVTAQIPAAAIDVTAWIGAEVARVRAHRSLAKSVDEADPIIREVAAIIANDFGVVAASLPANAILAEALQQKQYGELLKYRNKLIARRASVSRRIGDLAESTAISATDEQEAVLVARLLNEADAWYLPYSEERDEIVRRSRMASRIATKAQAAVIDWARIHGEIGRALEDGRAPSTETLITKAKEIQELVERLGEKNK